MINNTCGKKCGSRHLPKRGLGLFLALCLFLITALTACTPKAENSGSEEGPAGYPVSVKDHLGREVVLDEKPEKIVSGYYISTSMLMALGLGEKLMGVEAKAERCPIYSIAQPNILELPNVGSAKEFNLEGCAALEPDLVILPVKLEDSIKALEELGIKVIALNPEDKELLEESIDMISKAAAVSERGDRLKTYINETYENLAAAIDGQEKPGVYFAGNSSYLKTAGGKMYQNSLIEAGGGNNVAAGLEDNYWAEISYEQLIAWNPEVIIAAPGGDYTVDDILNDSALAEINAVKNGRVWQMPDSVELWDAALPSSVLGSLWIASLLHEEQYSREDYLKSAEDFYKEFYNCEVGSILK